MVLNLTRPLTSTVLPLGLPTRREQILAQEYSAGHDDATQKLSRLSKGELLAEVKRIRRDVRKNQKAKDDHVVQLKRLDRLIATTDELNLWAADFLVFEKPEGGSVASLRQAFAQDNVLSVHETMAGVPTQSFEGVFEGAEIFRVEHDWFKAIRKADEFENGSFRLPYEVSIFEFKISRHDVVAICTNYATEAADNEIVMQLAIESFFGWTLSHNLYRHNGAHWDVLQAGQTIKDDSLEHLVHLVGNQIRAACIALDAEVASTSLVRETYAGTPTEAKEYPEYEFYTINIASRTRADALQSHGATKGTKRLHFRRGHWRHYSASKTWVRWCLVGNPELGFIDKQYRL